jgi:hypothetical protein
MMYPPLYSTELRGVSGTNSAGGNVMKVVGLIIAGALLVGFIWLVRYSSKNSSDVMWWDDDNDY